MAEADVPVVEQAHGVRLMCDGYPGMTPAGVIDELTARFGRARAEHAAHGRTGAVEVFEGLLAFVDRHGAQLSGD